MPNAGGTKKKRLYCSVQLCGYNTLSWTDLSRHMRKHTGEKPYQCDKCDKKYSRQDKLVIHKRVHEGRRPFACPHCKYTAVDSSNLKKHVRSHTGYKPYKCSQCSYETNAASQLVVHTRKHTGDCPYLCMVENCGAAFKAPSDFKRHLRCHTGEKPFKCTQCNFEAAVKSNLSVHVRKHHSKPPAPTAGTSTDNGTDAAHAHEHQSVFGSAEISDINGSASTNLATKARNSQKDIRKPRSPRAPRPVQVETESGVRPAFSCEHCKYKVTRSKTLELHMRRKHKDILEKNANADADPATQNSEVPASTVKKRKAFTCSTCSASFVQEKSLKCHMRQHITPIPISVQPAPSPIVISVITYADSRSNCYPKRLPVPPGQTPRPGQK